MKNKISELKKKQRHKFSILRKNIHNNSVYDFNYKTLDDLFEINDFKKINIISSFFSIKTEISTLLLNKYLFKLKKKIVLPTIEFQSKILVFREYKILTRSLSDNFRSLKSVTNTKSCKHAENSK